MRVEYDAGGGTPFDATGAKATGASPGDAASAGNGFFALLALLQGGAATGDVGGGEQLLGEGEPAASEAAGEGGEGGVPGDVIVSLSGTAVASAAMNLGAAAHGATDPGAGTAPAPQVSGSGASAAGAASVAAQVAAQVGGGGEVPVGGATVETAGGATTVTAPFAAATAGSGEAPAPQTAATTATPQGTPTSGPAPSTTPSAPAAAAAAAGAIADQPRGATRAADGDHAASATTNAAGNDPISAASSEVAGVVERSGDAPDADGEPDERAFAGFGEARRSAVASTEGTPARVGLEPGASATLHQQAEGTRGAGAENVALARDGAGRVETTSRATGAVPRPPLGDGTTLPSWIERIASPQRLAARRSTALRLDLEPAGLGRIEVRLSFGRDGVRAQVMTEHDHTRALLAQQQPQLATAFERSDLRLESFLVDVGGFGDASGEAHREVDDPAAWDASFASGAKGEGEHEVPAATIVTGLLSVRA